jgi:hypothetical protein
VRKERLDIGRAQITRMAPAAEQNVPPDPAQILLFGAIAVMLEADLFAHLIQEPWGGDHGNLQTLG